MKNKLRGSAKDVSDSFVAAAAVAQSVKHSELRSLKEVKRKFDSWCRHSRKGNNPRPVICGSGRRSTCMQM